MLTRKRLKEVLHYDRRSGDFTWIKKTAPQSTIKLGTKVPLPDKNVYVDISIDGVSYGAHRLACLYVRGYLPEHDMDHKDRIRFHNAWSNLRESTRSCNIKNQGMRKDNKSGVKGVCWNKDKEAWTVWIDSKYVATEKSLVEAAAIRYAAEDCLGYPACDLTTTERWGWLSFRGI